MRVDGESSDAGATVRRLDTPLPEWVFRRVVNPLVRRLLRSPVHWLLSEHVLVLSYTGRRSGRTYAVPVGYEAHDGACYVTSATDRVWWTNLRGGAKVWVRVRGEPRRGTATVVEDDEAVAEYVAGYLDRHGRAGLRRLALAVDGEDVLDTTALAAALEETVVIRIDLDATLGPSDG